MSTFKLKNWSVTSIGSAYTPPELLKPVLQGNVYGHPRFSDGHFIHTSFIVRVTRHKRNIVTHSGSVYELGEADPKWEKIYPNAVARFFSSFTKRGTMRKKPLDLVRN